MNLNVSQQKSPGTAPVRYNLERPRGLPPVFMPSWGTLLNSLLALGALGAAALGAVIVGSGEKLPDVEQFLARERGQTQPPGDNTQSVRSLQNTLEDSLSQYDSIRSTKKFPDDFVQDTYKFYTDAYPDGVTRHDFKVQFLERYKDSASLHFTTKIDSFLVLNNTMAFVQTTTQVSEAAPVKHYVYRSGKGTGEDPATSVRYIQIGGLWDQSTDKWQVREEHLISSLGPFVKAPADSSDFGENAPNPLTPAADLIKAQIAALDSARSSGDYGKSYLYSNFSLDTDGDSHPDIESYNDAAWRFKLVSSSKAVKNLQVATQVEQAVQSAPGRVVATVQRRYTWDRPATGAKITATREEADFWSIGSNGGWYLSETRLLEKSPILTYAGL